MQSIIILKTVEIPNSPRFVKDQQVRIKDALADELVKREVAKYDPDQPKNTDIARGKKEKKQEKK